MEVLGEVIKIGKMDRKVFIHTPTIERTDTGAAVRDGSTSVKAWAFMEFPAGGVKEENDGGKVTDFTNLQFTIRYRTLTPINYLVYNSEEYDIIGIHEISRRRYLKLICQKRR
jgi:hypothetical protein